MRMLSVRLSVRMKETGARGALSALSRHVSRWLGSESLTLPRVEAPIDLAATLFARRCGWVAVSECAPCVCDSLEPY